MKTREGWGKIGEAGQGKNEQDEKETKRWRREEKTTGKEGG